MPGFKRAVVFVKRGGGRGEIKVEINRYEPGPTGNYGWKLLYTTGPGDPHNMGAWVLGEWKRAHGIPYWAPAAIDAVLMEPVPGLVATLSDWPPDGTDKTKAALWPMLRPSPRKATEEAVFAAIGRKWVEPERRGEWLADMNRLDGSRRQTTKEQMR